MNTGNNNKIQSLFLNPFLLCGLIGCFTFGSNFAANVYQAFWGQKDIWWTHMSYKLPLGETTRNFQIYISDDSLQGHLDKGTLLLVDNKGNQHPIVEKDITARVNNWYKAKSRFLTVAVFTGFGSGVSVALLCVGLIQVLVKKRELQTKRAG